MDELFSSSLYAYKMSDVSVTSDSEKSESESVEPYQT